MLISTTAPHLATIPVTICLPYLPYILSAAFDIIFYPNSHYHLPSYSCPAFHFTNNPSSIAITNLLTVTTHVNPLYNVTY